MLATLRCCQDVRPDQPAHLPSLRFSLNFGYTQAVIFARAGILLVTERRG
jgi:hypothetical protein